MEGLEDPNLNPGAGMDNGSFFMRRRLEGKATAERPAVFAVLRPCFHGHFSFFVSSLFRFLSCASFFSPS